IALGVVLGIIGQTSEEASNSHVEAMVATVGWFALALPAGYFVGFWAAGSTPAMKLLRLNIVDATTLRRIGFWRALLRSVAAFIVVLPCGLGLWWAAFDRRKRGWHDRIANTIVLGG